MSRVLKPIPPFVMQTTHIKSLKTPEIDNSVRRRRGDTIIRPLKFIDIIMNSLDFSRALAKFA